MTQATEPAERPYHALAPIPNIEELILDRIALGKSLKTIADEYGVSDVAIYKRVRKHPDYADKLAIGAELRMDSREQELESAPDQVSVSRARELLSHARWMAERVCPERFGAKTYVTGDLQVSVTIARGVTYEGEKANEISEAIPADSCVVTQE